MSELISGKEALIALANGDCVQKRSSEWVDGRWMEITSIEPFNLNCFLRGVNRNGEKIEFRLKPRTITINGIEVPAPFEPKHGDDIWFLNPDYGCGYADGDYDPAESVIQFGAWRTEEEIKQVVSALRSVFKGGVI